MASPLFHLSKTSFTGPNLAKPEPFAPEYTRKIKIVKIEVLKISVTQN
jgi:hypothetical protein